MTTTTAHLPDAAEWFGSDAWKEHLLDHNFGVVDGCVACAQRSLRSDIYDAVFASDEAAEIAWGLQDGYGTAGFTPDQGWDWSGIRDSSPAALDRIGRALGLIEAAPAKPVCTLDADAIAEMRALIEQADDELALAGLIEHRATGQTKHADRATLRLMKMIRLIEAATSEVKA